MTSSIRLAVHGAMLADRRRNRSFARAITSVVRPGDVVIDVGAGSALLAMLAARAGAKRVYALESSSFALLAEALVLKNGLQDVVRVEQCHSTSWQSPEPADVILSETLGFALFDERIRETMADARNRLMKPTGRLVPEAVRLLAAPVTQIDQLPDLLAFDQLCGLDYSLIAKAFRYTYQRGYFPRSCELAAPKNLLELDCYRMCNSEPVECETRFDILRRGRLAGVVLWFEAVLGGGISLDNRSPDQTNHWGQAFLPLERRVVEKGDEVSFQLKVDDSEGKFVMRWHAPVRETMEKQ